MHLGEESEDAGRVERSARRSLFGRSGEKRLTIQVLGGDDEAGDEYTVTSAVHALGDLGQAVLETVEDHESAHEGGHLHVGLVDEDGDERLEGRDGRLLGLEAGGAGAERGASGSGGRRREGRRWGRATLDHLDGLLSEVSCRRVAGESLRC